MNVHSATMVSAAGGPLASACGPAAAVWAVLRRDSAALARRSPGRDAPKPCPDRHFRRMQESGSGVFCGGVWPQNTPGRPRAPLSRQYRVRSGVLCGEKWPSLLGEPRPPCGANLLSRKDLRGQSEARTRVLCSEISPHNTLGPPKNGPPECYAAKRRRITTESRERLKAPSPFLSTTSRLRATPESGYYAARSRRIISPTTLSLAGI